MHIIEGNNILLQRVRRRAPKSHRIAHLFVCPGISKITPESFHHETRAHSATGRQHGRISKMTNFKLLGMAAIFSTMIATPGIAQEAVQEPGLQAFYQSLGVGSPSSATASAMASARSGSYASAPAKRLSAKHYANVRKM
jgi:hypothetical protein